MAPLSQSSVRELFERTERFPLVFLHCAFSVLRWNNLWNKVRNSLRNDLCYRVFSDCSGCFFVKCLFIPFVPEIVP